MPIIAVGVIERAQAMNARWPGGLLANVASPTARPSSSIAHAASVALWVSIPIAVMGCALRVRVFRWRRGSDGQVCVQRDMLL
jgi:hypothetical protein